MANFKFLTFPPGDLLFFLVPVSGLVLNAVLHVLLFKIFRDLTIVLADVIAFFIAIGAIIVANVSIGVVGDESGIETTIQTFSNVAFFMVLGFLYFALINIGQSSLRIRVLSILTAHSDGLSPDEISEKYGNRDVVDLRLKRLLQNGQIREHNGTYFSAKPRLIYLALFFASFRRIIYGKGN